MAYGTTKKEREERRIKYGKAREREITRRRKAASVMDLWEQTLWEGIEVHAEDMEPE